MAKVGQLQPIIVEMQTCSACGGIDSTCAVCWGNGQLPTLISGERRLTSAQNLGWDTISVRWIHELSPRERQIIELEENIRRADLPWQDIVAAVKRIHDLFVEFDPAWTQTQTAEAIGLDRSAVTHYLLVASSLDDSRVQLASTIMEAANIVRRRNERRAGEALEEFLGVGGSGDSHDPGSDLPNSSSGDSDPGPVRVEADSILPLDFLQWAPAYSGRRFNLIHCDFPYGIERDAGPRGLRSEPTQYSDTPDVYFTLLNCLCDNLPRLMSVAGHLMFWYSGRHYDQTMEIFRAKAPQLKFTTFPLIWAKSDGVGISADPSRLPKHIYETCLLASRGDQKFVNVCVHDAYSCPTDKTLHASTKPEPMLRHFMTMLVDENTRLLDPTAGSGAALRAAESLSASHVLGLEIDPQVATQSNAYLRKWRAMRRLG